MSSSNAPFDIINKIINLDGNTYTFNHESLTCGSDNLKILKEKETSPIKYNFPQGYENCIRLVEQEIEKGEDGKILVLNDEDNNNSFYFPLENFFDLQFTKMRHLRNFTYDPKKGFDIYENDDYPQTREYANSVIEEHYKKCGIIILYRKNKDGTWSRYYFKPKNNLIEEEDFPYLTIEMIQGDKLKDEYNFIKANKNYDKFPQGIQICRNLIQNQDKIFKIQKKNKNKVYYLDEMEFINHASSSILIRKGDVELNQELEEIGWDDMRLFQGIEYCKNFINERKEKGERVISVHIVNYEGHPIRYYI